MNKDLMIIDGNSLINRAFYALPLMQNIDGEYTNALYGFSKIIIKLINDNKSKYMAVAFDLSAPTFRHKLYKDYKGTRKKMPDELRPQIQLAKEMLRLMNIKTIEKEGLEADDLIGIISKNYDHKTIIITGDKDAYQLIDDKTEVWLTRRGISEIDLFNKEKVFEEYELNPKQFIDVKALMGDSSDNIPGIKGVGEKTALKLIKDYGDLDNLYSNISDITGKLKERLINEKQMAYLSKDLAEIKTSKKNMDFDIKDMLVEEPFNKDLYNFFIKSGFKSLVKDRNIFNDEIIRKPEKKVNNITIKKKSDLIGVVESIKKSKKMSIFISSESINLSYDKSTEFNLVIRQTMLEEGFDFYDALYLLKDVLEDDSIDKILFDSKKDMHIISKENITIKNIAFDVNLAEFLVNGEDRYSKGVSFFTEKYNYNEDSIASCMIHSRELLHKKLEEYDMTYLYYDIELKLINILYDMEKNGFKIDVDVLNSINRELMDKINECKKSIYKLAHQDFNINSPKQLSEILFEKFKLPIKGNKKQSTNIEVLESLRESHPIINHLIEYRQLTKLNSTYIEPYKKMIDSKTSLVHTHFNQTTAVTGRLSSNEPNLQNIPIRTELGRKIRKMFVSRFENGLIVSADYSQIELRIMAHLSGDINLINAYNKGLDIHKKTASDIFDISLDDITSDQRRKAKAVNFGIIYGISNYGLSKNINSSVFDAKNYIDKYFLIYKDVKKFMEKCVEQANSNGYVSTIFNRRRYFRNIHSANKNIREFEERAAMNMPLQGSASDIIKIAMIKVYNSIKRLNLKSKLILQVHDDLIIDAHPDELEKIKSILKTEMENTTKLKVPLITNISYGKSWFDND